MNVLLSESALLEDEMKRLKYFVVCHNNKDDTVIVYDPESITTYQARYAACVLRGGWDFLFTTTKTGNEKNSVVQISPVSSFERAFRSVLSYMEKLPTLHLEDFITDTAEELEQKLREECDKIDRENKPLVEEYSGQESFFYVMSYPSIYRDDWSQALGFDIRDFDSIEDAQENNPKDKSCTLSQENKNKFCEINIPAPYAPEVCEGSVRPECLTIGHFVKLGDSNAVFIRRDMLGHDVQRYLAQEQVRTDAGCSCDTCRVQHIKDDFHCEFACSHPVRLQISRNVHEDLVDGIHDDIFRGDVFQIDAVNLRAVFHVVRHTRRGNHKINCKFRPAVQFREGTGCAVQIPPRRFPAPLVVHLGDALLYLEQPAAARYAKGFDCRGRRQADSLVRPTFICND